MESVRLYKYYRPYNSGYHWLIYQFITADAKIRYLFNLGPYCGLVTFLTCVMVVIVVICTIVSLNAVTLNEKVFDQLHGETDKKIPRKKSVASIRPAYNCIHKHLQQTKVFQEKSKKMLCKEHLELEILNSRINCIVKLLKPEAQSEWRRTRSPKMYYRPINTTSSK